MSEPINKGIPPNPHPVKPPPNLPPPKAVASEPKRYDHFIKVYSKSFVDEVGARYVYPDAGMTESVEGKYVEWEDYARLKAEVDRLRKAGDAMACHLVCSDLPNDVCGDLMKNWNAAKEGKPSA